MKLKHTATLAGVVAAGAIALAGCFPATTPPPPPKQYASGTYAVPAQIAPGLWHSPGPVASVPFGYAERDGADGSSGSVGSQGGGRYMQVLPGDTTFTTSGFNNWVQAGGPLDAPQAGTDGDHRVGVDLAPGTYALQPTPQCWWQRLRSWQDDDAAVVEYGTTTPVVVAPSDVGLRVFACGTLTKVH